MTKPKPIPADVASDIDLLLQEYIPPELEETDLTVQRVTLRGVSQKKAKLIIEDLVQKKRIEPLGERRSRNGNLVQAWKIIA